MIPGATETVTLYLKKAKAATHRVVLRGVSYKRTSTRTVDSTGIVKFVPQTVVQIPEDLPVVDAAGSSIVYTDPKTYAGLIESERAAFWTVKVGDVIVLGEGPELSESYPVTRLLVDYYSCATIMAVADPAGSCLRHWEVKAL